MFHSPRDSTCWVTASKCDKNGTDEQYACDMCSDGGWTSETEVEMHKRMHYGKDFMKEMRKRDDYCYICRKQCLNKESVVKHIKTEHLLSTETCLRVEREIFICNKCSSIFFNKQNLYIHLRYAHLNRRNRFIRCVLCTKKIKVSNISAHFYSHNLQSVTTCRICLCKCKNTKALAEHLKKHPYYLKCDICCFGTSRVEEFQNHILLTHKNSVKNTKRNKNKLKGKKKIATESATVVEKLKDCAMDDTHLTENNEKNIDEDLITLKFDDSLITVEDLMSHQVKDDPDSKNNLMTLFDINGTEMADDVIKNESTNSDLMIDEVMSDSNLMTVIEISDQDITATDAASNTNLPENVKTDKDFVINDGTITEVNGAADSNLTNTVNPVKDLVSNDITVTEVKIESNTNLTDNVKPTIWLKPIKDLMSSDVIIKSKANTDNVVVKPVKDSADFKRFFVPHFPSFMRLQRIVGIRGIRLSNDVHICILCREICVGFEEMRSHVDEHTAVIVEESNSYECSCGEKFTAKIFLKRHAFISKHVI